MPKAVEDRVPLANYWAAIKGKNPDLSKNPGFKPDIMGPIKTYDAGLLNYGKLMAERVKLLDMLKSYGASMKGFNDKIDQQNAEVKKIAEEDGTKFEKTVAAMNVEYMKDDEADMAKLGGLLTDLATVVEDVTKTYTQANDQLGKIKESRLAATKKLRDDFKGKAGTIASGMKKIEDDTVKLEGQIRGIILGYQKVAMQVDKGGDLADAVRDLLTHF